MGLDVGDVRIGVALSDTLRLLASEAGIVRRDDGQPAARVAEMAREADVELVVIGLPRNMDGTLGPQARKVQNFAEKLQEELAPLLPDTKIVYWDERLTTSQAHNMRLQSGARKKQRQKPVDSLAATIILQNYLDYLRRT